MPNQTKNNYVIIMAGGIGSRFWPMSSKGFPKQFQDILGTGKSMIQQTAERFEDICPDENIYVVTNEDYVSLVKDQLPKLKPEQILGEPEGKNTAPCVAYAAYKIYSKNPDANLVVSPADHIVLDTPEFKNKIRQALNFTSENEALVTLGIKPSRPDTGYGYIKFKASQDAVKTVEEFTEKPDFEIAKKFVDEGNYLWNAGIFIWSAKAIIGEFQQHLPDLHAEFDNTSWYSDQEGPRIKEIYKSCQNISIDYGILEKSDDVRVIESDFGWSDLGTWNSLYSVTEKDENNNVIHGKGISVYNSSGNIIKSTSSAEKKVVIQGLKDFIVVDTADALMICKRENEQMVKQFVQDLNLND